MGCAFPATHLGSGPKSSVEQMERFTRKTQRIDERRKSTQFVDSITDNIILQQSPLDQNQRKTVAQLLKGHFLFSQLDDQEIEGIIEQILVARAKTNQYLFKQGDKGNCFFLIQSGQFLVEIENKEHKTLKTGQFFGQLALIYATQRTASVKCLTQENKLFLIKAGVFRKTLRQLNMKNYLHIKDLLNKVPAFIFLTNKQKASLANIMVKTCFKKDQVLFKEEEEALAFYIIMGGKVQINFKNGFKDDQGRNMKTVILGKNDSFGQNTFYEKGKRKGTATALEDTNCFSIGKNDIKRCLGQSFSNVVFFNIQKWALKQSLIFQGYTNRELDIITGEFKTAYAKAHEVIISTDSRPENFIVCLQGKMNSQEKGKLLCQQHYLSRDRKLEANIFKNDNGMYSTLNFQKVDEVLKSITSKRKRTQRASIKSIGKENECPMNFANFQYVKTLGEGQFGTVYLVKDPSRGNAVYALKTIEKSAIIKENLENSLVYQKRILQSISFSHIVGFVQAFSDQKYVYLLTEFIDGMEMFDVIREIGVLTNNIARHYFGTLMMCLEHLHSNNIIYRDLKPENSVVDTKGKVFLIDLGTAKILNSESFYRTFTIIGTPHYLAPEIMQGRGYSFEVDFWSLGILLYEFVCAKLPYGERISDPYAIYAQVMRNQLTFPKFFQDEPAKALIRKLASKTPAVRIAGGGFKAIKESEYFQGFDWRQLAKETAISPYIPKKFRGVYSENYSKFQGQKFLDYIYKTDLKKESKLSVPRVTEWDQKFK